MKQQIITDQPTILRIIVEQGITGVIRSEDHGFPGVTACVNDIKNPLKWYVITLTEDGNYSVVVLEGCGEREAHHFTASLVDRVSKQIGTVRLIDSPAPTPNQN